MAIDFRKLEDNEETRNALLDAARTVNGYDGSYDWVDTYEDFNEMFGTCDAQFIANKVFYGHYDPNADAYRFDVYGNIESVSNEDLLAQVWDEREDIVDSLNEDNEYYDEDREKVAQLAQ
jgi:hypothetical protein